MILALLACTPPPDPCSSDVVHDYDPTSSRLTAWPDDAFTVADSSSPTGRRVSVADAPWRTELNPVLGELVGQNDGGSGFATQGEIVLRFSDPIDLPADSLEGSLQGAVELWDLDAEKRLPYFSRLMDDGRQLMALPASPLATGHRHAMLVTTDHRASGQCIAPSPRVTESLESGTHDDLLALADRHPNEVSAVVQFTTHADHEPMFAAAESARAAPQSWSEPLVCEDRETHQRCVTAFEPIDYRNDDNFVTSVEHGRHRVPVTIWRPLEATTDARVLILGHGLGSEREDATNTRLGGRFAEEGFVVVAVDALQHHEHPTAASDGVTTALAFLGLSLNPIGFDGLGMRANFDQSVLERLQLIALLQQRPDLDEDGSDDVDAGSVFYAGFSLGGLMGNALLALSPDIDSAALPTAGGNLISVVRDTEAMVGVLPLLSGLAGSDAELEMLLSVTQSVVDPADPALWATYAVENRTVGDRVPNVLLSVSVYDEIVPPPAGKALGRAFPLPHIGPIHDPVDGLTPGGTGTISANHTSGATLGFYQFESVDLHGDVVPATHSMPNSAESDAQLMHYFISARAGQAEIIDPTE